MGERAEGTPELPLQHSGTAPGTSAGKIRRPALTSSVPRLRSCQAFDSVQQEHPHAELRVADVACV